MTLIIPQFPNSQNDPFIITSPPTSRYNCIAYAFGDSTRWYWPDGQNNFYWPPNIPRRSDIECFKLLFESIGYSECNCGSFEDGYEKIAIFTDVNNTPTHAAKQLNDGTWSSKLGSQVDVSHNEHNIVGGPYGDISVYMKRKSDPS